MTDGGGIRILTGAAPHSDPWHALDATSASLAEILGDVAPVRISTTAEPEVIHDAELVVVNASTDLGMSHPSSRAIVNALVEHHRARRPILAMHSSALAFPDDERWYEILGGRWVSGVTHHPQIGTALVQTSHGSVPEECPAPEADFQVYDERYTSLDVAASVVVLAVHTEDGERHPLMWWRAASRTGGAVAYDALGHGVESYDSAAHRAWIRSAVDALLRSASAKENW